MMGILYQDQEILTKHRFFEKDENRLKIFENLWRKWNHMNHILQKENDNFSKKIKINLNDEIKVNNFHIDELMRIYN